jgi:hypothetical protein
MNRPALVSLFPATLVASVVFALVTGAASAETGGVAVRGGVGVVRGVVYIDRDADGARGAGEQARPGVAVTNGRDVVLTDAEGRYELAEPEHGFLTLTCPADASCPVWFHRTADLGEADGDFGLVPAPVAEDFFFVQMSDAHVYPKPEDMAGLVNSVPGWVPRVVIGWFLLDRLESAYPQHTRDEIVKALRDVVAKHQDVTDSWDVTVMMIYMELSGDPSTGILRPGVEIPLAFAEVAALGPELTFHTGDMVLEGNRGDPESVERWYRYYQEVAAGSGLDIYETIGNNELGGTENDAWPPSDPRYGKALYRRYFGPTHYSFDHGAFHFAATDTHMPEFVMAEFKPGDNEKWTFHKMAPEVRDWLDADLEKASEAGRKLVVLNHEPFHYDPVWGFDDPTPTDDEGLFEKHGVAYSLSGHIHRNGFQDAPEGGGTTYITTGALSGFRWSLPTSIDSRGYRVFYAHDGELYSVWKDTGEPLLGFVTPRGDPAIHPASTHAPRPGALGVEGKVEVVAVAIDVDRPYQEIALYLGDEPLPLTRWGDYFVHSHLAADRLGDGSSQLELRATAQDGSKHAVRLDVSAAAAPASAP